MVDERWIPVLLGATTLVLATGAELLHSARARRVALLAFGRSGRPRWLARATPVGRALATTAVAWGLATLFFVEPQSHASPAAERRFVGDHRHVLVVLDVSPSMRLVDAGPDEKQSRMQRARAVMDSFFKRVPLDEFRLSVVATYNGAKPVVVDTTDVEVVRNVLGDLPMHYAFPPGQTKLFTGLEEAAKIARPWQPRSTTLIVVSDGDTVPTRGMPKMPASIGSVLIVGVGDPVKGRFIDGRQSRQDVSTLRQIAVRLGGTYHDGNEKHLSSRLIADLTSAGQPGRLARLTLREYALIAAGAGAGLLALMPLLLHYFGTAWRPGVPAGPRRTPARSAGPRRASTPVSTVEPIG